MEMTTATAVYIAGSDDSNYNIYIAIVVAADCKGNDSSNGIYEQNTKLGIKFRYDLL